jgi:type I restriction enzyme S subunit
MSHIDELLQRLCPEGVESVSIDELFEVRNGYTPSKAKPEYWKNGTIPWFRMDDIRFSGRVLQSAKQNISESAVQGRRLFEANSLIICTTATIGEHALITTAFVANQQFTVLTISKTYKARVLPKYLYFFAFKLAEFTKTITNSSGYATVDMTRFKKFPFLIPPLEVQQEIVRILDTFTELEAELEAELGARKKQYEHYRGTILSFPQEGVRWVAMAEFCLRNKGTSITADKMKSMHKEGGEVRIFAAGSTQAQVNRSDLPQKDIVETPGIVIKSRGYIGFEFCETPFSHKAELWSYCVDETQALPRFVMHYLQTQAPRLQALARSKSVKLPQLAVADTDKLAIPLPPIQQQKNICELLDRFEILTKDVVAGLPAEIEARRKQYEFYRNELLTFKEAAA